MQRGTVLATFGAWCDEAAMGYAARFLFIGSFSLLPSCATEPLLDRLEPPRPACAPPPRSHYSDADGNELARYDEIWERVRAATGTDGPPFIVVQVTAKGTSMFHPDADTVVISLETLAQGLTMKSDIAHESAHLFLAHVTKGKSTLEPFRFLDEGFASLVQHSVEGDLVTFLQRAEQLTAGRLREDPFDLDRLQRWSTFFGTEGHMDFKAYEVAASFVAFVEATYGQPKLQAWFRAIGETGSLGEAAPRALGQPLADVAEAWLSSLRAVDVRTPTVSLTPANGANAVPTDTTALVATFDVPMDRTICLETPCKDGVCLDQARWKDERTLEIGLQHGLAAHRSIRVELGVPGCRLRAKAGAELPVVTWAFMTP